MKSLFPLLAVLGVIVIGICTGCKSSEINDEGQAEKKKEQGQIDQRSNAIDKLANSAGG